MYKTPLNICTTLVEYFMYLYLQNKILYTEMRKSIW